MRAKPWPTLKARAITWLAQREHSRSELRSKLLRRARADANADANADALASPELDAPPPDPRPAVERLLDALETEGYLSASRFVASRVHVRAARFGNLRIRDELARHGLALAPEEAQVLQSTELERARAVWARKFKAAAHDSAGRARQARFLAGRGFSGAVIARIVRGVGGDD